MQHECLQYTGVEILVKYVLCHLAFLIISVWLSSLFLVHFILQELIGRLHLYVTLVASWLF